LQDIFNDIDIDIEKADSNNFNVIPLIRRIENKLKLNKFEELLIDKVFHLEEIFRQPYYLLEREIEKVHVSRAKRIPSKSYQYLASHTEDWIHKSIVSFKPSRILNEELMLNFDVYENQLTIGFLERCLVYFSARLKEMQDIKSFLNEYDKLLKNRNDDKGWYKKIRRNLSLIGSVYVDDKYNRKSKDGSVLSKSEEALSQINKRLLLLRKGALFELVNKRSAQSILLRNTNVLVNHKHYRYIKELWLELDKVKSEKSIADKNKFEQKIVQSIRSYGKSLITYTLKNTEYFGFDIKGNYQAFKGMHQRLCPVDFKETDKGIFELKIGNYAFKIIVIGNEPEFDKNLEVLLTNRQTYLFCYSERMSTVGTRVICINPLDPDSAERVGAFLRKYLLRSYLDNINKAYDFKHLLKDYIDFIPKQFLSFDSATYKYKFHSYPKDRLTIDEIKSKIEIDHLFKSKSRPDKKNILDSISELIKEINENTERLKSDYLNCFVCGEKIPVYNGKLNYIKCQNHSCGCLIDSSNSPKITAKVNNSKYDSLPPIEFGMDYLTFQLE
jgi:hypothetical protein